MGKKEYSFRVKGIFLLSKTITPFCKKEYTFFIAQMLWIDTRKVDIKSHRTISGDNNELKQSVGLSLTAVWEESPGNEEHHTS